jgi:hypothetical protein
LPAVAFTDRLLLVDGTTLEVDEAWEETEGVWYRRGGVTNLIARARVRKIERGERAKETGPRNSQVAKLFDESAATNEARSKPSVVAAQPLWIYLVGGRAF